MGLLLKPFQVYVYIAVMIVVAGLISAAEESTLVIHFERAPPVRTRFSSAVFLYTVKRVDGYNACKNNGCSIHCEIILELLDGQILRECPAHGIVFRNLTVNSRHNFLLNITTRDGRRNSSDYSWFIDTIRPTATIVTQHIYTSAKKIAIDVTYSETCTGNGGFKCVNSSNCDVLVDGPAIVQASSLHMIKPKLKYSLNLILSLAIMYARAVVRMADKFCTDEAGNHFTRTNGSIIIVHLGSTTTENIVSMQREGEGKRLKGLKLEPESELKKLRELAKASFSGFPKGEEGSTSYGSKAPTEFSSLKHKH